MHHTSTPAVNAALRWWESACWRSRNPDANCLT